MPKEMQLTPTYPSTPQAYKNKQTLLAVLTHIPQD